MELPMSKFKIVHGDNVTTLISKNREIKQLELEIEKKPDPTDRDLVIFAYHFVRLGHPLLAQKYMNKVAKDYFDVGIYKDLCQALLAWSVTQANPLFKSKTNDKIYEFFIIVKRVLISFEELSFQTKPAFNRFRTQFTDFSKSITLPHS
jgi:diketogulonate reductase-like aldo/keto reductase